MRITVDRIRHSARATFGILRVGEVEVFTLEDPPQPFKIKGITRIPSGDYRVKLRTEGGMHQHYSKRYGEWHRGMLWLQDVPEFEYVYIHIGNTPEETLGCILVGMAMGRESISQSRDAYSLIYPMISGAILAGAEVTIGVDGDD